MPANDTQISSRLTPEVSRIDPSQSILAGRLMCGIFRVICSRMRATTASGTQTKKVQRQPSGLSTMKPPSSGPPAVPTAITPPM